MDQQYSITNDCLKLLKKSNLPTIKKLRIEIKLIKIKRHLLNENISSTIKYGCCSKTIFNGLLCQMRGISEIGWESDAFNALLHSLDAILTALAPDEPTELTGIDRSLLG